MVNEDHKNQKEAAVFLQLMQFLLESADGQKDT